MSSSEPTLTALTPDRGRVPLAWCATCDQRRPAWLDLSDDLAEHWRCTGCDTALVEADFSTVSERGLGRDGYVVRTPHRRPATPAKLSGCGTKGVKSCGSGGCSSGGGCGSGGCSSGGCGR